MRLWHKDLIPVLPRQQLLGQWREMCAIMSNIEKKGTPNHVLVNRVMDYKPEHLYAYACLVSDQMHERGYRCDFSKFWSLFERSYKKFQTEEIFILKVLALRHEAIFSDWMTDRYLRQNYYNLEEKHDCGAISDEEFAKVREVCERVL